MSGSAYNNKILLTDKTGFRKEYTVLEFESLDKHPQVALKTNNPEGILGITYFCIGILIFLLYMMKNMRQNHLLSMIAKRER